MRSRSGLAILAAASLLASCAYYNGLYNAKDIAHRAEKMERQGRTLDAQGLWDQVAVRAETVVVRHPRSKWTAEARYLQGKALERTGHCDRAVGPLQLVIQGAHDERLADDAALALSTCQVKLGDLEGAGVAVERLINSPDPVRRAEAGWRAGIAYRRIGRTTEAITLLRGSGHRRARGELAAALADAGRIPEARALADSLLAERDTTVPDRTARQPGSAPMRCVSSASIGPAPSRASRTLTRHRRPARSGSTPGSWHFDCGLQRPMILPCSTPSRPCSETSNRARGMRRRGPRTSRASRPRCAVASIRSI